MEKFKAGDKVRQVGQIGPGELGDEFTVVRYNPYYCDRRLDLRNGQGISQCGWLERRFEKVEPELPQEWQDKIEAALGRDALVTLGVVEPEPAFKAGDRVAYANGGLFGTVIEQEAPNILQVKWDNWMSLTHRVESLREVETLKVPKQAIQVQFHVEAGDFPEARAGDLRSHIGRFVDDKAYTVRPDSKVTTNVYTYTETREVLTGSQA